MHAHVCAVMEPQLQPEPEPEPEQGLQLTLDQQHFYRRKFPELERVASNDPSLEGIFWHSRSVDDALVSTLAAHLEGNKHVRRVNLNHNYGITDQGAGFLQAVLDRCAVEHIRLGNTGVTDKMAAALHHQCMHKQLARLRANDASLRKLHWQYTMAKAFADLTMPDQLADAVRNNTHLLELDLTQHQNSTAVLQALEDALPSTRVEAVRYSQEHPNAMNSISRTQAAIKQVCGRNRVIRESIEASRPFQRLLLAAVYEWHVPTTSLDPTEAARSLADRSWLPLDLVGLVIAQLETSRSCPAVCHKRAADGFTNSAAKIGPKQTQEFEFDWHSHQLWLLGYS